MFMILDKLTYVYKWVKGYSVKPFKTFVYVSVKTVFRIINTIYIHSKGHLKIIYKKILFYDFLSLKIKFESFINSNKNNFLIREIKEQK